MFSFCFSWRTIPAIHPHMSLRPIDLQHTIRYNCNYWYMGTCRQHAPVDIVYEQHTYLQLTYITIDQYKAIALVTLRNVWEIVFKKNFSYQNDRLYGKITRKMLKLHSMFSFCFSWRTIPAVHPHMSLRPIVLQHTIRYNYNYWYMGTCRQHAPVDIVYEQHTYLLPK